MRPKPQMALCHFTFENLRRVRGPRPTSPGSPQTGKRWSGEILNRARKAPRKTPFANSHFILAIFSRSCNMHADQANKVN